MVRLKLPDVTLCAAASVNVDATLAAMRLSLRQIECAQALLFTDAMVPPEEGIDRVPIKKLESAAAYSKFLLQALLPRIRTTHCLIVQWDGFVLDSGNWTQEFLEYDYIGARWPQFLDGQQVGNGGFSLRSRRLLQACADPAFVQAHPEDLAICRVNRMLLERKYGIRFAPAEIADLFSFERTWPRRPTFGFHGVFNMIPAIGTDAFWSAYRSLDEHGAVFKDYWLLMRQLGAGPNAWRRRAQLAADRIRSRAAKRSGVF